MTKHIDIVFDGPPGPEAGRFVEVENDKGESIRFGEWLQRPDGYWVLRFISAEAVQEKLALARKELETAGDILGEEGYFSRARDIQSTLAILAKE